MFFEVVDKCFYSLRQQITSVIAAFILYNNKDQINLQSIIYTYKKVHKYQYRNKASHILLDIINCR